MPAPGRAANRIDAAPLSREHGVAFDGFDFAPPSCWKIPERETANAHANQPQRGMSDGGSHASHLTVFSFDELESDPGVRYIFPKANRRLPASWSELGIQGARPAGQRKMLADRDA